MTYWIKPLAWEREDGDGESWIARTGHGAYVVWIYGGLTRMITPFGGRPCVSSIAHGQQLAWEDWQARILPALEEVPETPPASEIDWLSSEKSELTAILAEMPEDQVIDRMGLEGRLKKVNQRLLGALRHVALQFGGQRPCDECDCPDCALLRPVLAAIAEAEGGRHQ